MTSRDETRRFFDSIAGRYDRVYAPAREESRARMARVLAELAPRSRVLDLGVGTGRELSSLQDARHLVTGLDLSPEMLARCARRSRPIPLVQADLWDALPFRPATFDAVLALHGTLAHPPAESAPRALAMEVARVLAPGGVFVLELPLPGWVDKAVGEDEEQRVRRVSDARRSSGEPRRRLKRTRAVMTDGATGASIEAWLLEPREWQDALAPDMIVTRCLEENDELFLTAERAVARRER